MILDRGVAFLRVTDATVSIFAARERQVTWEFKHGRALLALVGVLKFHLLFVLKKNNTQTRDRPREINGEQGF